MRRGFLCHKRNEILIIFYFYFINYQNFNLLFIKSIEILFFFTQIRYESHSQTHSCLIQSYI